MSTTEQIVKAAHELGKLIQEHPSMARVAETGAKLQKDTDTLRLLTDLNRLSAKIAEKEMTGKPIEAAEKQQLAQLQGQAARNELLRQYQLAQMDYMDLMRIVDQVIAGEPVEQEAPAAAAPATPGAAGPGGSKIII